MKKMLGLIVAVTAGAMAQTAIVPSAMPVHRPGLGPVGHGFGNVVFPGTGIPRGHIQNLNSTIRGVYPAPHPHRGGRGPVVYPVAVPVYMGGYGYGYGPDPTPNVTVINAPQPPPSVIVNNHYTPDRPQPVMKDYTNESLPEPAGMTSYQAPIPSNPEGRPLTQREDKPTIYLVALQDGSIYPSYAYWVEGDTLHYVTTKHSLNRISVSLVDVEMSERLNRERSVEFSLGRKK